MNLLEKFKNLTTGTPRRTLISSIIIALLLPLTLWAASQRWELRKRAAEICYKTTIYEVNKNSALRAINLSSSKRGWITFAFYNSGGTYLTYIGDWTEPQNDILIRADLLNDLPSNYQGYVIVESHEQISYPGSTSPTNHGPCIEVIKGTPSCPLTIPSDQFNHTLTFSLVFQTLNTHFWQPNGDWQEDMMHDATSFAPFVLYNLGKDCANQEYTDRANKTIEWEIQLVDKVLEQLQNDPSDREEIKRRLYPTVMGHNALIEGLENYSGDSVSSNKMNIYSQGGVLLANMALIFGDPQDIDELMPPGFNRVQAFAFTADADFQLARITQSPLWAYLGAYLTDQAIDQFWVENQYGGYFTLNPSQNQPPWAWDQGSMLVALSGAYGASGKSDYLNKKRAVVQTTLKYLWDSERRGFFNDINRSKKNLSDDLILLKGLIRWKQLDTSNPHDSEIQQTFEFLKNDLYYAGLFYHDWTRYGGRASHFCTGCNFFALDDIYELNKPIQIPSGIFEDSGYQNFKTVISDPSITDQIESFLQRSDEFFTQQFLQDILDLLSSEGCVPESLLPGDLDCDCDVDIVDIMRVAAIWNAWSGDEKFNPNYDFDNDGRISIVDIMRVASKWNTRCPQ